MKENDLFELRVGRLIIVYKKVKGNPQMHLVYFDKESKLDPLKVNYEVEFAQAKASAQKFFQPKQRKKAR